MTRACPACILPQPAMSSDDSPRRSDDREPAPAADAAAGAARRWQRTQALFHAALERPAADRAAWVAAEAGDPAVAAEVLALLAADAEPPTLLDDAGAARVAAFGQRTGAGTLGGASSGGATPTGAPVPASADAGAAPPRDAALPPGTRLGPWIIGAPIGRGGMSVVYEARHADDGRAVALKVLRPDTVAPSAAARFRREILLGSRLAHPNLLPVLDADGEASHPWLAMPRVHGGTLRARMRAERRLPVAEVLALGSALAGALAHVHEAGVVHRDVKPENVLLDGPSRAPRLADLGIARALEALGALSGGALTLSGLTLGTPAYMSPEQFAGRRVGPSTDVWSLAVVLHEALTGRPPFRGAALRQVLTGGTPAPEPVTSERPDVPVALAALLRGMLAPFPDARPSAAACARALAGLLLAGADDVRPVAPSVWAPLPGLPAPGDTTVPYPAAPPPAPGKPTP